MKKFSSLLIALQLFVVKASLFAQSPEEMPPARDQGFMQSMIMMAIALLFFYFILWRPEQKRRKEMDEVRSALKPNDQVTAMGILGTVVKVQEHTVILKMYDGSKIEVVKGAITDIRSNSEDKKSEDKKIESIDQKS
ncbi:MAG TPA: preprotein translocase subunit YajC [Parachlamydiaceae bacterium]|nr:preprotein translocase subunit YajC [Parachlamydiaceae bacterium]